MSHLRRTGSEEDREREPLLGEHNGTIPAAGIAPENIVAPESDHPPARWSSRTRILILLCVSIVAADFGNYLAYAPQLAIFESIICRQHHPDGVAIILQGSMDATSPCKSPDVQGELAILNGWKDTFDQIPGIIMALPCGFAADRIGRKPIILLALTGLLLEEVSTRLISWWSEMGLLPLRILWLVPVFQFLGGGPQIASSMVYAVLTDIFPMEQRASLFCRLAAAILLGEILATPLSAVLMSHMSPWVPSFLGLSCQIFGLMAAAAISETRPTSSELPQDSRADCPEPDDLEVHAKVSVLKYWKEKLKEAIMEYRDKPLSSNIMCILAAFFFSSISKQALQFLVQYASKRFGWTIAQASSLVTVKGVVNLLLLLIIIPQLSSMLSRHLSPRQKDLRLVQGSIIFLIVGSTIMSFASHPVTFVAGVGLFALGWGFFSALRSLATELVPSSQIGLLNMSIALSQNVGGMIAGPSLAAAFKLGVELSGMWMGLPYMVAVALFMGAGLLSLVIKDIE